MVNIKSSNQIEKTESQSKGNLDPKWPQPYFVSRFIELINITKPIQNKNGLAHVFAGCVLVCC